MPRRMLLRVGPTFWSYLFLVRLFFYHFFLDRTPSFRPVAQKRNGKKTQRSLAPAVLENNRQSRRGLAMVAMLVA